MAQSTVIPASTGNPALKRIDHLIGGILVDAGRLKLEDAERILQLQREQGLLFGDAAIKLGLLTEADIHFALSRQFNYPYLVRGESKVSRGPDRRLRPRWPATGGTARLAQPAHAALVRQ